MRPLSKILLSAAALFLPTVGKSEVPDSIMVSTEVVQSISSGDHTPFWLVSNRQGLSSIEKNNGYMRFGVKKDVDVARNFSWGACIDVAVPWRFTSDIVLQQMYGELKYRCLWLTAGLKETWSESLDHDLSSGGILYSGNSRPIPQLRAGIFEFQPLRLTNDWIAIKGYLSYGLFADSSWQKRWVEPGNKWTSGVLYCSRGLWLRNGDSHRFPLVFTAGLEMATQFGGESHNFWLTPVQQGTLHLPGGFAAWLKALVPLEGGQETVEGERTNVQGNMIGVYDFSLEWVANEQWSTKFYWQHMFEDHSMLWIDFPWKDGLWGVEAKLPDNPFLGKIVCEYLYSKFQSGPVYNDTTPEVPEQVSGVDEYYNHYIYTGWQNWGMGIGNPFSISPIYNKNHKFMFYATRNISWHMGLSGTPLPELDWRVLLSHTKSWGTYWYPFEEVKDMWNFMAEAKWNPSFAKDFEGIVSIAFDRGDLIGQSFGASIGLRYTLPVRFR